MLQFFLGRLASIATAAGIAAGSVIGSPVVSFGTLASSAGIPSSSVVGNPTSSQGLVTSAGLASGSVVGSPVVSFATLPTSAGLPSSSLVGAPVVSFATLATSTGIPSGSIVGTPAASLGTIATVGGIPSGSVVGSPVSTQGLPTSAGIPSGSVLGSPVVSYSGTAQTSAGIPSGSVVGTPVSSNPAATESLEKMIVDVLLASPLLTAFEGRIWTRGAREGTKAPYAVVHDFSRVPEYHSKGRHHEVDDAQVTVYATTAAEANLLAEVCNNLLTFADLKAEGVTNLQLRSRRSLVEKGRDGNGRLVYSEVLSYRGSVERLTPNR
jgi:hypothetical protein